MDQGKYLWKKFEDVALCIALVVVDDDSFKGTNQDKKIVGECIWGVWEVETRQIHC